ncbi:MAG: ferrous iron transport protein B [Planctomycetota bacterium]
MTSSAAPGLRKSIRRPLVVVAGNPNTGKTTIFNRLTGSDQKVANYPGVTVERHTATIELTSGVVVDVLDVPGSYSLSAHSREEELAIQTIAGLAPFEVPDLVVVVADATQLSRNLYLCLQILELGVPLVLAVNMADMLETRGEVLDLDAMRRELGIPVVSTSALHGRGLDELRHEIEATLDDPGRARPGGRWTPEDPSLESDLRAIAETLPAEWNSGDSGRARALAIWSLLSLEEKDELDAVPDGVRAAVAKVRDRAARAGRQIDLEIIRSRYAWIDARMPAFLKRRETSTEGSPARRSSTDRVDAVLLHPVAGFAIFLLVMGIVFQSLFSWADPAIRAVEGLFAWIGSATRAWVPDGIVEEFVEGGLIAGVGSVVVFLPQILLLFLFIGFMEDSGYMARVAFLMDRIMRAMGLHGRAFVPMLSGYACAVPAILATRTMERQRDRTLTMMVIPLMTCSARLPVYTLIIGTLFPPSRVLGFLPVQGLLMIAMYVFSTLTALVAAMVLSRTLFKGPPVPLILELPSYRMPHLPSVLRMMWLRTRSFLESAGTVILVCTVVLWALLSFPRSTGQTARFDADRAAVEASGAPAEERDERIAAIDRAEDGERLRSSYGGRLGRAIEPTIEPLGFDWKIGIGLIGAFAAREVFVSTMGVVYGVGGDTDEESATLREKIRAETHADGRTVYTPLAGLSLMVFFALACQCMSTLAAVRRETKTWRWPLFVFVYMSVLAWLASFVVYQGGRWLGLG